MEFLRAKSFTMRDFASAGGGNATVMLCLSAFAVMGCAAAVDYVRLARDQTLIAAAANSAALAAVSSAMSVELGQSGDPAKAARLAGQHAWDANIANSAISKGRTPVITVVKDKGVWTSTVTYDAGVATSFMSVLGFDTMRIAGSARRSGRRETSPSKSNYWDINLVVDTSSPIGNRSDGDRHEEYARAVRLRVRLP